MKNLLLFTIGFYLVSALHAQPGSPFFSIPAGSYAQDTVVSFYTLSGTGRIFYSLDGSVPDSNSIEYTEPVVLSGDGSVFHFKLVSMDPYWGYSNIVETYYAIDYSFSTATYLTDLTWDEYHNYIIGSWIGHMETPWCSDYTIFLTVEPDGHYSAHALSPGIWNGTDTEFQFSALYYGVETESPLKTLLYYDLLADGSANGIITLLYMAGSTTEDELRYIRFPNRNNLYMQMWHASFYGPLEMWLVKTEDTGTEMEDAVTYTSTLFPNPAHGAFNIVQTGIEKIKNISISNIAGQTVLNNSGNSVTGKAEFHFDISNLSPGIYLVELLGENHRQTLPLVVN